MAKYSKDGEFNEPVVRCDCCGKLLLMDVLRREGRCDKCGHRKIKNLFGFDKTEYEQMLAWGIDPEFLALFQNEEGVPFGR
jgi:hypothetical protein